MAMGVSYDEFWHGDYCKLKFYEERYYTSLEQENYKLWLQGAYFYSAMSTALAKMFGGNKTEIAYPERPFDLNPKPKTERDIEAARIEAQKRMQAQLEAQRTSYIARHGGHTNAG